jgi:hypothetical protein
MKAIIDGRGTGKTSRLLLLAKENDGVIVCHNPEDLRYKAYSYGLVGIDFISFNDYIEGNYNTEKPVFIDELNLFLKKTDKNICGYTLSEE